MRISVPQHKGDPLANFLEFCHIFWFFYLPVGPLAIAGLVVIIKGDTDPTSIQMTIVAWILLVIIILGRYYMITHGYRDSIIFDFFANLIDKQKEKKGNINSKRAEEVGEVIQAQQKNNSAQVEDVAEHNFWLRVLVEAASDMEIARQLMTPTSANPRERLLNARRQLYSFCNSNRLDDCDVETRSLQNYMDYSSGSISPKVKRAFLLLEDGDWEKANKYLEEILDEDPTDAYAYIGKMMIENQIPTLEALEASSLINRDDKNYQKAIRFANKELSKKLKQLCGDDVSAQNNKPASPQKFPLQTAKGTIWVTPSVAEIIVRGETKRQYELDPDESKALLDFALSLLYEKR